MLQESSTTNIDDSLIQAVIANDEEEIKSILEEKESSAENFANFLNQVDSHGKTALHYAAEYGHAKVVMTLMTLKTKGLRHNVEGCEVTPIHLAAKNGHGKVLEILIGHFHLIPDSSVKSTGYTALHFAVENDQIKTVKRLLKLGASALLRNNQSQLPRDLTKSAEMKAIFDAVQPSVEILGESVSPKALQNYAWRRGGKKWEEFKRVLKNGLNHENRDIAEIVRMNCQLVRIGFHKQAQKQLLYYLCERGLDDVIDFLIVHGIDFTSATYRRNKNVYELDKIVLEFMGLYAAIYTAVYLPYDRNLRVIQTLLKTDRRILYYLHPRNQPTQNKQKISPTKFAKLIFQNLKDNDNKEKAAICSEIINFLEKKEKRYEELRSQNAFSNVVEYEKERESIDAISSIKLKFHYFNPEISAEDSCVLSAPWKSEKTFHPKLAASQDKIGQPMEEEFLSEEEQKEADRYYSDIGIWGESAAFFRLKKKYEEKYQADEYESVDENSVILRGKYPKSIEDKSMEDATMEKTEHPDIKVKITWNNLSHWKKWQEEKKSNPHAEYRDSGKHYDIKIKKTIGKKKPKIRFVEVKSTINPTGIVTLSGHEYKVMKKHEEEYRIIRCANAGKKSVTFAKYKDIKKQIFADQAPIHSVKFKFKK